MTGKLEQTRSWLSLAALIFGVIGSTYGAIKVIDSQVGSVTTDAELESHNTNEKAHPFILSSVKDCEGKVTSVSKDVEESRESQVALGSRLVRLLATEQETNKNLKAAAANFYENEFHRLVRKGMSVEEAMIESLRQPFYTRPRGY